MTVIISAWDVSMSAIILQLSLKRSPHLLAWIVPLLLLLLLLLLLPFFHLMLAIIPLCLSSSAQPSSCWTSKERSTTTLHSKLAPLSLLSVIGSHISMTAMTCQLQPAVAVQG